MSALINVPEFQSGVIPFVTALVFAFLLKKPCPGWVSAGVIPAFLLSAFAINGFDLTPLTGTRKIMMLSGIALIITMALELYKVGDRARIALLFVLAISAAIWVAWPVINRIDTAASWLPVCLGLAYVVFQVLSFDHLRSLPLRPTTGLIALGLGTGASAILAASALFGQLSLSLSNAVAALLLMSLFTRISTGALLTIPVSLTLGLLGFATMIFAELSWYTLVLLGLVPLFARINILKNRPGLSGAMILFMAMIPAVLAVASVWLMAEESAY